MHVKIICEGGVNHAGNVEIAMELADIAKESGCDAFKTQTFWSFPDLKHLELTKKDFRAIKKHCQSIGIEWMSTPFSIEAVSFLKQMRMKTWKIPSGMVTNRPYLLAVRNATGTNPIIMSTGMCNEKEIRMAAHTIYSKGIDLTLMQCTTAYPTPYDEVNLMAIKTLETIFPGVNYGLSDHTMGIEVAIAAVGAGATVIEKHLTIDRNMEGPDHKASIEPDELRELVRCIRNVEQAMGTHKKEPTKTERDDMGAIRVRMEKDA